MEQKVPKKKAQHVQVLQISSGERDMGDHLDLAIPDLRDGDIIPQIPRAAFDFDAVVQKLFERGEVEDLVRDRLGAVDGVLCKTHPQTSADVTWTELRLFGDNGVSWDVRRTLFVTLLLGPLPFCAPRAYMGRKRKNLSLLLFLISHRAPLTNLVGIGWSVSGRLRVRDGRPRLEETGLQERGLGSKAVRSVSYLNWCHFWSLGRSQEGRKEIDILRLVVVGEKDCDV